MPFAARLGFQYQISAPPSGGMFDADAAAYITAVETADGAVLEEGIKTAINDFVVGCKADGTWATLDHINLWMGPRTLNGALVPLKGTAFTNVGFTSSEYNRVSGIKGSTSLNQGIDSNVPINTYSTNDFFAGVFKTEDRETNAVSGNANEGLFARLESTVTSDSFALLELAPDWPSTPGILSVRYNNTEAYSALSAPNNKLISLASSQSGQVQLRAGDVSDIRSYTFGSGSADTLKFFNRRLSYTETYTGRLAMGVIGSFTNHNLLQSRIETLKTDIAAAI